MSMKLESGIDGGGCTRNPRSRGAKFLSLKFKRQEIEDIIGNDPVPTTRFLQYRRCQRGENKGKESDQEIVILDDWKWAKWKGEERVEGGW